MSEAVDAFTHAADSNLFCLISSSLLLDAARKAITAMTSGKPSETDAFLPGSWLWCAYNPPRYVRRLIPSAEDTGFFQITEQEIIEQDKKDKKIRRKHRHTV